MNSFHICVADSLPTEVPSTPAHCTWFSGLLFWLASLGLADVAWSELFWHPSHKRRLGLVAELPFRKTPLPCLFLSLSNSSEVLGNPRVLGTEFAIVFLLWVFVCVWERVKWTLWHFKNMTKFLYGKLFHAGYGCSLLTNAGERAVCSNYTWAGGARAYWIVA